MLNSAVAWVLALVCATCLMHGRMAVTDEARRLVRQQPGVWRDAGASE